jgi:hypothetical protein
MMSNPFFLWEIGEIPTFRGSFPDMSLTGDDPFVRG